MSIDGDRLDELLDGIPNMGLRAEAREFARMNPSDQMLHLYLGQRAAQGTLEKMERDTAPTSWKAQLVGAGSAWAGLLTLLGWLLAGEPKP